MHQVFIVHGGEAFDTYEEYLAWLRAEEVDISYAPEKRWKSSLPLDLGETYQVIAPRFPNSFNAKYLEWKIWFEKHLPFLRDDVIFIGHSLGGIFLAKYLAEERLPIRVLATLLVAAVFDGEGAGSVADFVLPADLSLVEAQGGSLHLFHSTDDPVVPYAHAEKYQAALPHAQLHTFHDRQHFNQEEFPELVAVIRTL